MGKKIAFLYAGQGSQYPGMGKDLCDNFDFIKEMYDKAEEIKPGIKNICFESTKEELGLTVNTQPALFLTDMACARALINKGIKPDVLAGFSLGEIPAICQAGILDDQEAFSLVKARGELMNEAASKNKGGMVAVLKESRENVEALCKEYGVYPVNYNSPGQIVVSGAEDKIEVFKDVLKEKGIRGIPVAVSGPFHTPYMQEAGDGLSKVLDNMDVKAPSTQVYSNYTATNYPEGKAEIVGNLSKQVCNPVMWEDILVDMKNNGVEIFIECGPGQVLSGLVKRTLTDVTYCNVSDVASLEETVKKVNEILNQ